MEGLTLDQLAVFAAVVDAGSFSGAARRLNRAQSAVTYAVQHLEAQTGTELFDRSAYRPSLTPAGRALLPRARRVLEGVADYRRQARSLLAGAEPRITLAVDVVAPAVILTSALKAFKTAFPTVEVAILVQPMDATLSVLRQGIADMGVIVDVPGTDLMEGLERVACGRLSSLLVAAPDHPLARMKGPVRRDDLRDHVQILLSSGAEASGTKDWGGHAVNRWRVNDLGLRRSLLLEGLGWCSMPRHFVAEDLEAGRLIALRLDPRSVAEQPPEFPLSVAHLRSKVLGPAGMWLRNRMSGLDQPAIGSEISGGGAGPAL
ncbi:LysR family transcriptional regulator [Caulobacter soli]|uniref:LysR family transcriptional regulator n=1 Tax=Caulobacter soli TaxID=2708539 RepID=UPI0013EB9324|nr:LysR family transcriptional regulator [Caulobacter soli]